MKRTFLVTVEGEDAHKRWFDPDTIREHIEGWTDTTVTVTETTSPPPQFGENLDD